MNDVARMLAGVKVSELAARTEGDRQAKEAELWRRLEPMLEAHGREHGAKIAHVLGPRWLSGGPEGSLMHLSVAAVLRACNQAGAKPPEATRKVIEQAVVAGYDEEVET